MTNTNQIPANCGRSHPQPYCCCIACKAAAYKLRGRWLLLDGQPVACIVGKNDGTTRRAPHSFGGYGYQIVGQERTTLDWSYFDDAVKACRAALAKVEG